MDYNERPEHWVESSRIFPGFERAVRLGIPDAGHEDSWSAAAPTCST